VTVLHGHKAGICTMAQIKGKTYELLASGGDQGCGSVILWDLASWKLKTHFTPHSAAVSSIMDFNDYELLVSCSYDKTIKVINHVTNNVIMNIPNHTNSPIVAMSLNSHCNRLVSASLDCSLNVWKIKKMKEYGSLESISHERKLELGDVIC
jgi:WD40 repeat protein